MLFFILVVSQSLDISFGWRQSVSVVCKDTRPCHRNQNEETEEMIIKEKELQALDELVNILSKECREYLLYKLQVTPLTTPRKLPYSLIKNSNIVQTFSN